MKAKRSDEAEIGKQMGVSLFRGGVGWGRVGWGGVGWGSPPFFSLSKEAKSRSADRPYTHFRSFIVACRMVAGKPQTHSMEPFLMGVSVFRGLPFLCEGLSLFSSVSSLIGGKPSFGQVVTADGEARIASL